MGPLGNGFTVLPGKKAFLVGGGIGIPPMLQLAKDIQAGCAKGLAGQKPKIQIVAGYRDSGTFLLDEFRNRRNVLWQRRTGALAQKARYWMPSVKTDWMQK